MNRSVPQVKEKPTSRRHSVANLITFGGRGQPGSQRESFLAEVSGGRTLNPLLRDS